jgi:hypothetical protein
MDPVLQVWGESLLRSVLFWINCFAAYAAMDLLLLAFVGAAVAFNTGVLYVLAFLAGVACLSAVMYLSLCTYLIFPAIVVEDLSALGGVKRAIELIQNRWCYVFGMVFSYLLVVDIGGGIIQKLILGTDPTAAFSPIGVLVSFLPQIFFLPALVILQTLLYLNLRIDKEGLNFAVLNRDVLGGVEAYSSVDSDETQSKFFDGAAAKVIDSIV